MLMNVVLENTGQQRELLHHKWVVVTVMGVTVKEVNEVPTANVRFLNDIIIVTTTESEGKQILTLILTPFHQPE